MPDIARWQAASAICRDKVMGDLTSSEFDANKAAQS
jgi:hypothetical protein